MRRKCAAGRWVLRGPTLYRLLRRYANQSHMKAISQLRLPCALFFAAFINLTSARRVHLHVRVTRRGTCLIPAPGRVALATSAPPPNNRPNWTSRLAGPQPSRAIREPSQAADGA
ncbi:hypothetical protein KC326_g113 [Hortaea werneckii]|nr:hypothetical protein KC326_g113 [Hortaea werneckii]